MTPTHAASSSSASTIHNTDTAGPYFSQIPTRLEATPSTPDLLKLVKRYERVFPTRSLRPLLVRLP